PRKDAHCQPLPAKTPRLRGAGSIIERPTALGHRQRRRALDARAGRIVVSGSLRPAHLSKPRLIASSAFTRNPGDRRGDADPRPDIPVKPRLARQEQDKTCAFTTIEIPTSI